MSEVLLQANFPIIYPNGTMQPHFRDYMLFVDNLLTDAARSAEWDSVDYAADGGDSTSTYQWSIDGGDSTSTYSFFHRIDGGDSGG